MSKQQAIYYKYIEADRSFRERWIVYWSILKRSAQTSAWALLHFPPKRGSKRVHCSKEESNYPASFTADPEPLCHEFIL